MVISWAFFYARGGMEELYKVFYVGFIALVGWPAFQKAIYAPMYGPAFWRAKVANGWVPPPTQDFYAELARYKEERGVDGQLPGDMAWALAYSAIYVGTMLFAILMTWLLPSWSSLALLVFSLVEFLLAFGCMLLYGRRNRRQFDQALRDGYPFSSYLLGRLHRLQP